MSLYDPDSSAFLTDRDYIRQLSQRDLSLRVPVNFVSVPGVSLTAACFPDRKYETSAATKCISNILASEFRRLYLDLYWDPTRSTWTFCPVELGGTNAGLSSTQTGALTSATTTQTRSLSMAQLTGRRAATKAIYGPNHGPNVVREPVATQDVGAPTTTTTFLSTALLSNSLNASTTTSSSFAASSSQSQSNNTLIQVGPYSCTPSLDFDVFMQVLASHLKATETDLYAMIKYVLLNIYVASPASDPTAPASSLSQSQLPRETNYLSQLVSANASQYLYTPDNLSTQRSDVNASGRWFSNDDRYTPDSSYLKLVDEGNYDSSPDGWPGEGFIEFVNAQRLLVGFGTVSPQLKGYNFSADASTIFPIDYLQGTQNATVSGSGEVSAGCLFMSGTTSITKANSSWAISTDTGSTLTTLDTETGSLTDCGYSPILNTTISSASADKSPELYASIMESAIWSWAPNEPLNRSASVMGPNGTGVADYACAALNASSGRWQTDDCGNSHFSACRPNLQPYDWRISQADVPYEKADQVCQDGTSFLVPRTGLENRYLLSTFTSFRTSSKQDGTADELLWLNFNDLDVSNCWVEGQNSSCPYSTSDTNDSREIVVPTIAAVLVFVIAALTVFIKCAANRQNTKRRRRRKGDDGWDYEGVPA